MDIIGGSSITSKGNSITRTKRKARFAYGCQVRLDDGTLMTDWAMGLHGALDGYSPKWLTIVLERIEKNATSLPAESEQMAADRLQEFYPDMDSVRFMSDGSSPNEAAVRLARAYTYRHTIAFCGYHGTGTSFPHNPDANDLGVDERRGIPWEMWRLTQQFKWGDFKAVEQLSILNAAIIVEVPSQDEGAKEFLGACYKKAREIGALLVLDDVVTGFRVAAGGAQERYGVEADLVCIGKALGNGFNVSALLGKHEVMGLLTQGVHYSSTYNGSGLATGIAAATLRWISENKETIYPVLYAHGELLKMQMNQVFENFDLPVRMVGNATRPILVGAEKEWLNKWRDGMFARGFYCMKAPFYLTMSHTEDVIFRTVEACYETCREISMK